MPLSIMHRQYIPSARMAILFLFLLLATGVARAATFGVTTPGQQTLTNRFLPYAGSGTQLIGNSPAWRDSAGVLGINNYLEGLETLTPGAAVNLDFSTWRTKRITLNQNTVFTAINIPSASTNVQTMLLEVIGDGAFTVSFANVTWQTPEITTPEAGVVTLYALRGDSGAVKGYTQAVAASGVTTINPTDGYLPYRSNATTFADSPLLITGTNAVTQFSTAITNTTTIINNEWNEEVKDGNSRYLNRITPSDSAFSYGEPTGLASLTAVIASNASYMEMFNNGGVGWRLNPGLIDNGDTPYQFNGSIEHTTGDYISSTNATAGKVFAVKAVSGYTGAGTLFLSDNGTYKAVGGTVTESFGIACSDETTPLITGTAKVTFRMPYAFTVTAVRASLTTAQASGNIFTVDINEGASSILSTKITIDNTETTSTTAVTAPVISDSALADDASMTIDIDQIGNGSATGLKVWIIGHQ